MSALGSSLHRVGNSAGVLLLLSLGCGDAASAARDARQDDASMAPRRVKPRTVTIELWKTTGPALEQAADGSVTSGASIDLAGVEVCVAKRRPAFASFQPFKDLDPPLCATSVTGETVLLSGVPANSDLVITFAKDGYRPETKTFRTDEFDVAAPAWGSLSNGLGREGEVPPDLEPEPRASPGDGTVSVGATAIWAGGAVVPGEFTLNVAASVGVSVEIKDADGRIVSELSTLRGRGLAVSLPEGSYALRFSHPRMNIRPAGVTAQYSLYGLSTAELDTIEAPVFSGHNSGAFVDALCAAPRWDQRVDDLATCTLAQVSDAGTH